MNVISYYMTKKGRMKNYSKLFTKQFNDAVKNYENDEYDNLLISIQDKYKGMIGEDKNKLLNEKIKAQDNINNCFEIDTLKYISIVINVMIGIIGIIIGIYSGKDIKVSVNIDTIVMILFITFLYVTISITALVLSKVMDIISNNRIKGYNIICLSILEKLEHELDKGEQKISKDTKLEVFADNESKIDEILENTVHVKKFLGI